MAEYIETHGLYDFQDQATANNIIVKFVYNLFKRLGYEVKIEVMDTFQRGERKIKATWKPTADVQPVRHGRWENAGRRLVVRCSCCQKNGNAGWNYCPNCGAKMDGEDE